MTMYHANPIPTCIPSNASIVSGVVQAVAIHRFDYQIRGGRGLSTNHCARFKLLRFAVLEQDFK